MSIGFFEMHRRRAFPIVICWALLGLLAGCGYKLHGTGEAIGVKIDTLAIPLIQSPSSSPGFESTFTGMIREEFASHSKVPLVAKQDASVVLVGRVRSIKTEPYTYRIQDTKVGGETAAYEVTNARWLKLTLEAKLLEKDTGKVIWEERAMREKATYQVGSDPLINRYNEKNALREIARNLARRIYLKTMERF